MTAAELEKLRFPIGPFLEPETQEVKDRAGWVKSIASFPAQLEKLCGDLSDEQLAWRYRPAGWSIRQLVHHCADSHMNALIRFKLALTETKPTIKPYEEAAWAELADAQMPVAPSLHLIEALHSRWIRLLVSMDEAAFSRTLIHPEHQKEFSLHQMLANYAWHGEHHLAHVRLALDFKEKFGKEII